MGRGRGRRPRENQGVKADVEVADAVQAKTTFTLLKKNFFKYNCDTFIHSVKCRTHDNVFRGRESHCPWIFSPTYFSLGGTLSKEHIETEQKALRKKKNKRIS